MTHPDWVLKHKLKNTELRNIKGRYYLYNITSKWDPEKGRTKKVTLGQVGVITEEHGLIPTGMKRKGKVPKGESVFNDKFKDMKDKIEEGFLDVFSEITDPRSERNQLHTVAEIFLITLSAAICGADGWQDVEDFGWSKLPYLRQYLAYKNGIPSDDTIRRFYRSIDTSEFEKLFRSWVTTIAKSADVNVIAIDGKSSRHSFDKDGDADKNMLHTLSAFSSEARIVLGQERVSESYDRKLCMHINQAASSC